jgi:hypothetical protein
LPNDWQIYCWDEEDQELDFVEGLTPTKTEKEMAGRVGAGNVEAPAPNDTERKKKKTTLKELTEPYQGAARDECT